MKEKNGKTIVIVILVILLLGAVGFITYDKLLKKDTKEEKDLIVQLVKNVLVTKKKLTMKNYQMKYFIMIC